MSEDQDGEEKIAAVDEESKKAKAPKKEEVVGEPSTGEIKVDTEEEQAEDVEALSHKEMRRRKKAEKAAARAGANGGSSSSAPPVHPSRAAAVALANTTASSDTVAKRSKHSVWVGNLLFSTSAERLQDWFEQKGVLGITRVNMPQGQKKSDHNRGFAYVDVPSAEALQTCIDLSESNLDGRRLLIKSGTDYTGRPEIDKKAVELAGGVNASEGTNGDALQKGKTGLTKTAQKILRAQKHSPGPTLFIGNLSFNSTEDGLREMIERSAAARDEWSNGKAKRKVERKKVKKEGGMNDGGDSEGSSSEGESSDEGEDDEIKKEDDAAQVKDKKKKSTKADGLRGAGIRKIRMGQFEDTGKCKG
jgi:RNA recognition motif-containing protein